MFEWPVGIIVPVQDPTPFSPFAPSDWATALGTVAGRGFDGAELAITDPCLLDSAALSEALDAEGLRLLSITTGQSAAKEGLSLSSDDDGVRARAIQRIQDHMKLAKDHGAVVIVGSLRGADGDLDLLVESLRACAASEPSVRLALEPLNRYESRLVNTVNDALGVIDRVGAENLGILFDTFHANIEEATPAASLIDAGDRLAHVHLADSNRWVPGYGHFRFAEIWEAMERIGYAGPTVFEPLPLPSADALLKAGEAIRIRWSNTS
ncbi:TIM barrel protein [Candidatus Bipolaricaulota bacterium]